MGTLATPPEIQNTDLITRQAIKCHGHPEEGDLNNAAITLVSNYQW